MNTENLKSARKASGKTQKEVADALGVGQSTYKNYECGIREPNGETIVALANLFDVTTDYLLGRPDAEPPKDPVDNLMTVDEMEADLMKRWMELKPEAREIVLQVLRDIVHADDERKKAAIKMTPKTFKVKQHEAKVSAGVGFDLEDEEHWTHRGVIDCQEAHEADFAIEVDGDSMEPEYHDGDYVFVVVDPNVPIGKIGIFADNEKGYIKMRGKDKLISLNPEYDDIPLTEDMRCIGRVIGIATLP